jgi:hypothetical protein
MKMALDRDSEQKVCKWIAGKGNLACPLCKGKAWAIGDLVGLTVVPTPLSGTSLNIMGANVSLHVPVTCVNCAYTMLLAAAPIGIVAPKPKPHAPASQ